MRLSSFTSTQQAPEKAIQVRWWVIYGRVGSFKITEISINPNPVCHFVVVFRCIYVHVFYHCRHITVYWSKIRVFGVFSYPTSKTTCTMLRLLVLTQYQRVTDRRTDAPIMAKSRNKTRKMTNAFVCRVPLKVAHILLISQQLGLYTVCLKKPDRYD